MRRLLVRVVRFCPVQACGITATRNLSQIVVQQYMDAVPEWESQRFAVAINNLRGAGPKGALTILKEVNSIQQRNGESVKITIIGGSRGTGAQLASLAKAAGHEVTTVSRSGIVPDGVRSIVGSATDPAVATEAVTRADAVVVTVGGTKGGPGQRATVTRSIIAAMQEVGARRLVVQSSLGAGDSASQLPAPLRLITKILLAKPLADHNEQEASVRTSGLAWTVLRPTGLTNKPPTGQWHALEVASEAKLHGSISRADLAACMLEILEDDSTIGKSLGVSSR